MVVQVVVLVAGQTQFLFQVVPLLLQVKVLVAVLLQPLVVVAVQAAAVVLVWLVQQELTPQTMMAQAVMV
tara:strand:- start:326 stop:535 length:210 start_codon:yes stop_codon:yes gene_type:complete